MDRGHPTVGEDRAERGIQDSPFPKEGEHFPGSRKAADKTAQATGRAQGTWIPAVLASSRESLPFSGSLSPHLRGSELEHRPASGLLNTRATFLLRRLETEPPYLGNTPSSLAYLLVGKQAGALLVQLEANLVCQGH